MTHPSPSPHDHGNGFAQDNSDFAGHRINGALLSDLVGAACDGCVPCQDIALDQIAEDPATTGRLVSLACLTVQEQLGGLPNVLMDPAAPGLATLPFRALARAGADAGTESLTTGRMWEVAAAMTPRERKQAADTALDLVAGNL